MITRLYLLSKGRFFCCPLFWISCIQLSYFLSYLCVRYKLQVLRCFKAITVLSHRFDIFLLSNCGYIEIKLISCDTPPMRRWQRPIYNGTHKRFFWSSMKWKPIFFLNLFIIVHFHFFESEKRRFPPYFWSDDGVNGTMHCIYRALPPS